jgi:hypothetical protein
MAPDDIKKNHFKTVFDYAFVTKHRKEIKVTELFLAEAVRHRNKSVIRVISDTCKFEVA